MVRSEIAAKTLDVFKITFGENTSINEQTTADDIHKWDSLNHILLIQALEKEFGLKFNLFEIIELRDVFGIIEYIYSKFQK